MSAKRKKSAKKGAVSASGPERCRVVCRKRSHRQVFYLNDDELAAIRLYSGKFGVKSRSALFRESVLMRVLTVLDDAQPTLF